MTYEPRGHRGHPYDHEARRAARLAIYIERATRRLEAQGFSPRESIHFIAGVAYDKAADGGETWANPYSAVETIDRILEGRGAKSWSMDAIVDALMEIAELTKPEGE